MHMEYVDVDLGRRISRSLIDASSCAVYVMFRPNVLQNDAIFGCYREGGEGVQKRNYFNSCVLSKSQSCWQLGE